MFLVNQAFPAVLQVPQIVEAEAYLADVHNMQVSWGCLSGDRAWDHSHITWHFSVRLQTQTGKYLAPPPPSCGSLGKFQSFPGLSLSAVIQQW